MGIPKDDTAEVTGNHQLMRSEVLTAVEMSVLVVWAVTPCGLVGRDQCFLGTYCLHLQG
jgi:hypothetical protein